MRFLFNIGECIYLVSFWGVQEICVIHDLESAVQEIYTLLHMGVDEMMVPFGHHIYVFVYREG